MAISAVYLCNRFNAKTYERPLVYKCKDFLKEANSTKTPILIDSAKLGFHGYEYIAFPKIYKFNNEDIYLTLNNICSRIEITYSTSYRCVGIEVRSLLRLCWVPIEEDFFEKLLIEYSNPSENKYRFFQGISGDNMVNGSFKIEDGFLRLDK